MSIDNIREAGVSGDFSRVAALRYNSKEPFVLVDAGAYECTRGDVHGYIGVATALAKKIGAKLRVVNDQTLLDRYPLLPAADAQNTRTTQYFAEEGCPDFYFSREPSASATSFLTRQAKGILIRSWNERLPYDLIPSYEDNEYPLAPHNLTADVLAREGERFAQEFGEMPRPFIGINLIEYSWDVLNILPSLPYNEATFFIVSCHRTSEHQYDVFMKDLRCLLARRGLENRFHIVAFNLNHHAQREGQFDFWNPYKGMLAQADHIVQCGGSNSIISETLAAGKAPYLTTEYVRGGAAFRKGYIKYLFQHKAGHPFERSDVTPPDITGQCADGLIKKFTIWQTTSRGYLAV